jgi:hypothetical protein
MFKPTTQARPAVFLPYYPAHAVRDYGVYQRPKCQDRSEICNSTPPHDSVFSGIRLSSER